MKYPGERRMSRESNHHSILAVFQLTRNYQKRRGGLGEHAAAIQARQGLELATTENVAKMWIDKYVQQRFQGEGGQLSSRNEET